MPMSFFESRYDRVGKDVEEGDSNLEIQDDRDDRSESTLASEGLLSKALPFSHQDYSSPTSSKLTWIRWGLSILLQVIIIGLLLRRDQNHSSSMFWVSTPEDGETWTEAKTETGGDVNGLYIPSE